MNRFTAMACALVVFVAGASAAPAQNPQNTTPSVLLMQAGADRLMEDLQYLLSLTTPQEQQQWQHIQDWIEEMFLPGIDRQRPVGIEVILAPEGTRYRSQFPIARGKLKDFRDNLNAFGIPSRQRGANFFALSRNFVGFMRYRHDYAIIAEKESEVPLTIPDPKIELLPLVQEGFDAVVRMHNDPAGADARRQDFQRIRNDLLATVKQNADETREAFELRRTIAEQQLNELERFYAESQDARLGWTTDGQQHKGRLDIALEPIAGTSLAQSIKLLGTAPSHFANVARAQNSILSVRVNHPLDQMRKDHAAQLIPVARSFLHRRVDDDEQRDAEQKIAGKKAADMGLDIIDATARAGIVDGMVEVTARPSGKHALIAGIRVADGNAIHPIVQMLPQTRPGRQVQMDVAKVGETRIHKVELQIPNAAARQNFYGEDLGIYIGGDKNAVWFAIGEGALQDLQAAIEAVSQPNQGKADDPFVELMVKLGPWIQLRNQLQPLQPKAPAAAQRRPRPAPAPAAGEPQSVVDDFTQQFDRAELRRFALEAFAGGDDILTLRLSRVAGQNGNDKVGGNLAVERGVLRMVGKGLAAFSKENLDPNAPGQSGR